MTQSAPQNSPIPEDMLNAIIKTFIVQHVDDTDEHLAQALVYNAGRLAYRMREAGVTTEYKTSLTDVVTAADRAAEKFVADALRAIRPDDGLLGEEGTRVESKSGRTWVIDPLDGTFNFTVGSDYWCAAVALVEGDPANPTKLLFGAVHRPAMGYTWFGGPTIPTTCDGKAIHVANAEPAALSLSGAFHANQTETWKHVLPMFATARMNGSASVDLAGVASGAAGCWLQHSLPAWDWLPGRALVEGAGGVTEAVPVGDVVWYVAGGEQAVSAVAETLRNVDAAAAAADTGADGGAYAADLALALELADLADSITMDRFEAVDLHIESKPDLTPVSDADTTVEEQLRAILATKRPDDAILGEEFGGEVALQGRQWVIDPIDGTKNFVRGVPVWATLISLLVDGKPVVGVVSAPALNRRWWAATGSGAYRSPDNRRLTTSNVTNLADASISISSLTGWQERGLREELIALTDHAWRLRGFGDFWSYMLVAEGTVDVAAEPEVSLWDLAALVPIVEEAGGTFTNIEGAPGPHGGSAIATNTHLHDAVLRAIQP